MNPDTLRAAAAIIDARAAHGHPEWARIADALSQWAADMATASVSGPQDDADPPWELSDPRAAYEAHRAAQQRETHNEEPA
jgi:hypothetical protein